MDVAQGDKEFLRSEKFHIFYYTTMNRSKITMKWLLLELNYSLAKLWFLLDIKMYTVSMQKPHATTNV